MQHWRKCRTCNWRTKNRSNIDFSCLRETCIFNGRNYYHTESYFLRLSDIALARLGIRAESVLGGHKIRKGQDNERTLL